MSEFNPKIREPRICNNCNLHFDKHVPHNMDCPPPTDNYDAMTVGQLRSIAVPFGIMHRKELKKDELIKRLRQELNAQKERSG